jgi:tRNA threonylcarbamoyl adenosine modification protein (Sua5/YciO/YrdC/YwlC family)
MSQFFQIHAQDPQPRLINQAAEILGAGGLVIAPSDCAYALTCPLNHRDAVERVKQLRKLPDKHNMTLMCRDFSELSTFAKVDNSTFRLLRALTPGAYTFILNATREVPRRLYHPKKRTIGIRVPDNSILQALLAVHQEPVLGSSLILSGDDMPLADPYEMRERVGHFVDLIIDGGFCGFEATTVVDLTSDEPVVMRVGAGDPSPFGL